MKLHAEKRPYNVNTAITEEVVKFRQSFRGIDKLFCEEYIKLLVWDMCESAGKAPNGIMSLPELLVSTLNSLGVESKVEKVTQYEKLSEDVKKHMVKNIMYNIDNEGLKDRLQATRVLAGIPGIYERRAGVNGVRLCLTEYKIWITVLGVRLSLQLSDWQGFAENELVSALVYMTLKKLQYAHKGYLQCNDGVNATNVWIANGYGCEKDKRVIHTDGTYKFVHKYYYYDEILSDYSYVDQLDGKFEFYLRTVLTSRVKFDTGVDGRQVAASNRWEVLATGENSNSAIARIANNRDKLHRKWTECIAVGFDMQKHCNSYKITMALREMEKYIMAKQLHSKEV